MTPDDELQEITNAWQQMLSRLRTKAEATGRPDLIPIRNGEYHRPPAEFKAFAAGYRAGKRAAQAESRDAIT
jgi:hypothetical protein